MLDALVSVLYIIVDLTSEGLVDFGLLCIFSATFSSLRRWRV